MPEHGPITVLVLGPMQPTNSAANAASRTKDMASLVRSIIRKFQKESLSPVPIDCDSPDDNQVNDIIPGILRKLERADLVICDLSGQSPNVMYELGLVHALGLPYIVVTEADQPPFYVTNVRCITNFVLGRNYNLANRSHRSLYDIFAAFLNAQIRPGARITPEEFAANPVTSYFNDLPIVDISAPAGLAAGYWRNCVQRFVRHDGYFDPPMRTVTLAGAAPEAPKTERPMKIGHLVVVPPGDGLQGSETENWLSLDKTLQGSGFVTVDGAIAKASIHDLRSFGAKFLARTSADGSSSVIDQPAAVVIDMPTTLYALQYSARIMRITGKSTIPADPQSVQRLRARRYQDMIERFGRLLQDIAFNSDYRDRANQLHYVTMAELPRVLNDIVQAA